MRTIRFVTALLLIWIPGCATPLYTTSGTPPPPPPSRAEIEGTWLSVSSFVAHRLDLFADGTGALAVAYRIESGLVRRYKTTDWALNGEILTATFVPVDPNRETVYLRTRVLSRDSLRNVSLSLSSLATVPVAEELTRPSRITEFLNLLMPPESK